MTGYRWGYNDPLYRTGIRGAREPGGDRGPYDRNGLSRNQRAQDGYYDIERPLNPRGATPSSGAQPRPTTTVTVNGREYEVPTGDGRPSQSQTQQPQARPQQAQTTPRSERPKSPAMQEYEIQKRAYDMFPYVGQEAQRGRAEQQIRAEAGRNQRARESGQFRQTHEQRMEQERLRGENRRSVFRTPEQRMEEDRAKTEGRERIAAQTAQSRDFRTRVMSDNTLINAYGRLGNTALTSALRELGSRRSSFEKNNPGEVFKPTDQDERLIHEAASLATRHNLLHILPGYTPGAGVNPTGAPAAPVGAAPTPAAPAAPTPAAPATATQAPQPKPGPNAPPLATYRGETPPPNWSIPPGWTWGHSKSTGVWEPRPPK